MTAGPASPAPHQLAPWPTRPPIPAALEVKVHLEPPPVFDAALRAEEAVVRRAQAGDVAAMRELYEDNVAMVHSFVARRVGRDGADDLTAEVFTKAFERLDRFEWRGIPIRSWLLRIAFNEIVGRARRKASSEVVTDRPNGPPHAGHEDQLLDSLTTGDAVLAALATLSPPQRAAIELRYLRDLTVTETAVVLDLGEDAVRALTYRALKALRRVLPRVVD